MKRTPCLALILLFAITGTLPADEPGAPVSPEDAPRRMSVPDGFHVKLFAGEPDVRQPIAFTIDHRGRLWVAECYSYPEWTDQAEGKDRILIFEDTDGDGRFDRRTVFVDKMPNLSGLALGFGGVWACSSPNLLFIPDRDGDDVPDVAPVVKLDGWNLKQAGHNVFNALNWGPDGWLYGCNGIQSNSRVGKPGTSDADRVAINCGVWRYHPTKGLFEAVAHGTTNPWGLDFDDYGEAFITNCVIPHLYHVIPGAHFERMYGQDFNTHLYGLIGSSADHIHWAGGNWQDSRGGVGKHGEAGGGHAHVGAMIYLGDSWPDRYRNSLFTCNLHGHRVNNDPLERKGSGYVARHGKDFLFVGDSWFRGLELKYGPDGSAFLTDWSDTGECHESDADGVHRENGRIYKISYGPARPVSVDLAKLNDDELVKLQLNRNDWYVRTARRLLQERAASGQDMRHAHQALREILQNNADVTRRLRALWALHATGGADLVMLMALLDDRSENLRGWAIRLLCEGRDPGSAVLAKLAAMAKDEQSPLVRLALASALQRIPIEKRWGIADGLVTDIDYIGDHNLPLMIWYGIEPLVPADRERALGLAVRSEIPLVRQYIARRVVNADPDSGLAAVLRLLGREDETIRPIDLIAGVLEALRGRKHVAIPQSWPDTYARLARSPEPIVREQANLLGLRFGDTKAVSLLRETLMDPAAKPANRQTALQALVESRQAGLAPQLRTLIDDPAMCGPAIRAMAAFEDPATPGVLVGHYRTLDEAARADAVGSLASRPAFAKALLDALEHGTIPRRDISATTARQLQALGDHQVSERLERLWGALRPTSGEKVALAAKYKAILSSGTADAARGRLVFNRTCLQCHRLYDAGGDVGPDLTGSDRANVDYILENVLDPGAAVGRDFQLTNVATTDGRLISGIIREQSDASVTIQTPNDRIILPREDIEELKTTPSSMMPEGLLDKLSAEEVRDLFSYLASKSQLPLPNPQPPSPIPHLKEER